MMLRLGFLILAAAGLLAGESAPDSTTGWSFVELHRMPAAEANQGVAADATHLFVISNHEIGQYRKDTGERTAGWACAEGEPLIHLNAGIVHDGRLYCAHSNYPGVPNLSSVEIWDAASLRHVGSHSFGRADGSLTWIVRRGGRWLACFVHYGKKGGEPGRGPEWSRVVEYDDAWRETGGWAFPVELVAHVGARGYAFSGGAEGPGGYLYVTGHDQPELYVLAWPEGGSVLRWIATIPIPAAGQAFGWDPGENGVIYLLSRKGGEVIAGRVQAPR